jgi:cation diffusion facilitator family transporter
MNESAGRSVVLERHSHVFLAADHARNERRTWAVITLCGIMMVAEIVGGLLFGSIALVADGMHMSTHAGALMLAALAYSYARRHANDERFTFGTGKLGDLAGFTSAIVLVLIALLIGYESIVRLAQPVPIQFAEAIPIACLGLAVNIGSAWLLGHGGHVHVHGHGHVHGPALHEFTIDGQQLTLALYEEGAVARFRVHVAHGGGLSAKSTWIETVRADGSRQVFPMRNHDGYLESIEEVPQPHNFTAYLRTQTGMERSLQFLEHEEEEKTHRDNNMRAAIIHVAADAAVSIFVIIGLVLARTFGWMWMDPVAGIVGASVIASWSYGLIRDTSAILLDMNPDRDLAKNLRATIEGCGDQITDLHVWRVGPGHVAAIVSVVTQEQRSPSFYHSKLERFKVLSHVTVEIARANSV